MSRRLHRLLLRPRVFPCSIQQKRHYFATPERRPPQGEEPSFLWKLIDGTKLAKVEFRRLKEEWKENLLVDRPNYFQDEVVPQFNFRLQKDRDQFQIVADSDYNLGFSKGEFVATRQSTGLFKGFLDTRVPNDGKTVNSGYVVLQGFPKTRSFYRQVYHDWEAWTHMVIRCRGDGRSYMINMHVYEDDDMSNHFLFSYPLYTRGGPYWQITTVPFSKFFLAYKGAIQDKQHRVELHKVTKIGIALFDRVPGPFELEIDYIGCMASARDESEDFAYETYETSNNYGYAFGMK